MKRVLLLVEGQTEEAFTNVVLRPHLAVFGVHVEKPSMLRTKELPAGKPYKGGVTSYERIAKDARRLLSDTNAIVTTLVDYYGLPSDFPGVHHAPPRDGATQRVLFLEQAFADDIGHTRFRPFLMLHEFEAWVFAAAARAGEHAGLSA